MPQYVLLNPITVVSPTGVVTHRAGDTLSTDQVPYATVLSAGGTYVELPNAEAQAWAVRVQAARARGLQSPDDSGFPTYAAQGSAGAAGSAYAQSMTTAAAVSAFRAVVQDSSVSGRVRQGAVGPFLGLSLAASGVGAAVSVLLRGNVDPAVFNLGAGAPCVVGVDASGVPVRVTHASCVTEVSIPVAVPQPVRPSPLSDDAKTARAPLPPEQLVAARNDRVHVEKGKLIKATPLMVSKPK